MKARSPEGVTTFASAEMASTAGGVSTRKTTHSVTKACVCTDGVRASLATRWLADACLAGRA